MRENFLRASRMQYWSKAYSNRLGLSIAATLGRFGHTQAKILIAFQNVPLLNNSFFFNDESADGSILGSIMSFKIFTLMTISSTNDL